ncbi:MAG: LPS export ABC transporter permease LptG [Gammaproteobacteria bacterium]|nr:LPS export ABC transporter permease LptG [Gammaproteobacteria bacterium]
MRQLDRYIAKSVSANILLVLFVLVGLFGFFSFVEELDEIGAARYGLVQAIQYVILQTPRHIYELFPMAALMGSLLGLGVLANSSELTVMRASGVSIGRIVWSVMKIGFVFMLFVALIGEKLAPASEQHAKNLVSMAKSKQIALQTKHGFWARDGRSFINIRRILPEGRLGDVSLYEFDELQHLIAASHAHTARYQEGQWILEGIEQTRLQDERISTRKLKQEKWDSVLSPVLINILILRPSRLSAEELYKYIRYLKENGQRSAKYELAFWLKVVYPLLIAVMIFLSVPFVFGTMRSVSTGQRVLIGTLLGIGFYIINETIGQVGLLYNISPLLCAVLPSAIFLALAVFLARRVV